MSYPGNGPAGGQHPAGDANDHTWQIPQQSIPLPPAEETERNTPPSAPTSGASYEVTPFGGPQAPTPSPTPPSHPQPSAPTSGAGDYFAPNPSGPTQHPLSASAPPAPPYGQPGPEHNPYPMSGPPAPQGLQPSGPPAPGSGLPAHSSGAPVYGQQPGFPAGPPVGPPPPAGPPQTAMMPVMPPHVGGEGNGSGRAPWVPILAGVSGLLLLLVLLLAGLYVKKNGEYDDTKKDLASTQSDLDDKTKEAKDLDKELDDTKSELSDARSQLGDSEDQADRLAEEKQVIGDCLRKLLDSTKAPDEATKNQILQSAQESCMQTFQIFNITP